MEVTTCLGIFMDHAMANLLPYKNTVNTQIIKLAFTHEAKMAALHHNESGMHHKEQQLQEAYYKQICTEILKYNRVLLFGPTNAKKELHNYILKDYHFNNIEFTICNADKMTDNEKVAFVKNHFDNSLS
jgi:stalled ribosome rescue protein Dom34